MQTYLTPERKRQLAVYCFEHDVTMAEVLEAALERYLREEREDD